jgi:hypothetical protein
MRVVQLAPRAPLRWLTVSVAAAVAALAWREHKRPAAPPAQQEVVVRVTAVPAVRAVDPATGPHFAIPPPGDPYPRPDLDTPPNPSETIDAQLIQRDDHAAMCGTFAVWSVATFRPLAYSGEGDLRVLVECAELLRPREVYRLTLAPADDVADGKNDALWRASRVDPVAVR